METMKLPAPTMVVCADSPLCSPSALGRDSAHFRRRRIDGGLQRDPCDAVHAVLESPLAERAHNGFERTTYRSPSLC